MLKKLLLGIPKKLLIANAVITLAWGLMNSYMTVALSKVTAAKIEKKEFLTAACFFIGFILIWELLEFVCDTFDGTTNAYIRNASYDYYYKKLYFTKPEALQRGNTGYIAGILTQLIEKKCTLMFSLLLSSISIIYVGYLIIYIAKYSLWFSAIVMIITALGITIRLICSKMIQKSLKDMTVVKGEQTRIFMDGINNISTVQKLRGLDFIQKKSSHYQKLNLKATLRFIVGNEIGFTLYKTVNYMLCPICMFVAFHLYNKDNTFPIIEFMAYLSIVTVQLVHNNKNIAACIKDFNMFSATQREMDEIIKEQSTLYTSTSIGDNFNTLSIENLEYQYGVDKEAVTISIPEFHINKGEKICITGESGQGKTTLLKILSGIIETDNKIYKDNEVLDQNIDAVYIAQDTEMLDLTLRDNLTFGNDSITDDKLTQMLDAVGMGEWLMKQSDGLDTLLGERGVFVSTGQRQRLNVIRGLLMNKEIYLLDEPTSNVDEGTETRMIELIQECLQGKTVIIVTHKEKICEICDRKYIFEDNKMMMVS